jgi:hypothetical protein
MTAPAPEALKLQRPLPAGALRIVATGEKNDERYVKYQVGDVVQWVLGSTTGEGYFIGHRKANKSGQILVLATAAEVGIEIDAEDCHPTGRSYPATGAEYRHRYFRQFPGKLAGNA